MATPTLKEMVETMEKAMSTWDLSDEYLAAHNQETREEAAYGEWSYGISMVPCDWVYPYLKALSEDERLSGMVECIEKEM